MSGAGPAVVVTGLGSVSALAIGGGEAVGHALRRGRSGIAPVRGFATDGCPSRLAGQVGDDLVAHLRDDEPRRLPRVSQLAVVAARLALADAGLEPGQLTMPGLVLGSAWGDFRSSDAFARGFLARGPLGLSPLAFPSTVMNAIAAHVAIAVGARGPMLTLNDVGVAGELAVVRGARLLAAGRASAVLVGGADELPEVLYRELARLGTTSPGCGGAEGCRPFDRRANGTVLGEGATVLVLEARPAAAARGARVYAELAGAACGNLPSPAHGFPAVRRRDPIVVRRALAGAGLEAGDVDAAYLTGTGCPEQDACELELVARALGPRARARITALTPLAGDHAGLGVLRAAAAALGVAGWGVPSLGALASPVRDDLRFAVAAEEDEPPPARAALVHGLARGGTHVALALRAPGTAERAA
jgi:3-oxoacyl-(acyl-carrier-protein) synthase